MNSSQGPIFIVGPARSGTELVRSMLNRHPSVHIASETHYFDDLRPRIAGSMKLNWRDREKATAYFERLACGPYFLTTLQSCPAASKARLGEAATADELFEAFCKARAAERGKSIWGEKTPRHVFRGAEILSAFPEARLIATVRDPRAVVASYQDWRKHQTSAQHCEDESIRREARRVRASYSITIHSLLWVAAMQAAERLRGRFGAERVHLLKYERLVDSPDRTLRELCEWLNIEFTPQMAAAQVVNSTYLSEGLVGVQTSAVVRWRRQLSVQKIAYIQWLTGKVAVRNGYEQSEVDLPVAFVVGQLLATPFQCIRAGLANRDRIGALPQYILARLPGFLGLG